MAQTVLITLYSLGADTGPFDLYSNADAYATPFETGISKLSLQAGYSSSLVPDLATIIRVKSNSVLCQNYEDLTIVTSTTTSTTSTSTTSTSTSTTTSTTTSGIFYYTAFLQVCGGISCADSGLEVVVDSPSSLTIGDLYSEGSGTTVYRITGTSVAPSSFSFTNPIIRTSSYCCL